MKLEYGRIFDCFMIQSPRLSWPAFSFFSELIISVVSFFRCIKWWMVWSVSLPSITMLLSLLGYLVCFPLLIADGINFDFIVRFFFHLSHSLRLPIISVRGPKFSKYYLIDDFFYLSHSSQSVSISTLKGTLSLFWFVTHGCVKKLHKFLFEIAFKLFHRLWNRAN